MITDREFETHVWPLAVENWASAHGGRHPATDAEYDEVDEWAAALRVSYDSGEMAATWR